MSPFDGTLEDVAKKKDEAPALGPVDQWGAEMAARLEASRSLKAVADALSVVQADAMLHGTDILRHTSKVLEALVTSLSVANEKSEVDLRSGAEWARTVVRGGSRPRGDLVEKLHELVKHSMWIPPYPQPFTEEVAVVQAAIDLITAGFAPGLSLKTLTKRIERRFRKLQTLDCTDAEKFVKRALQAGGMAEPEARNAVNGKRL